MIFLAVVGTLVLSSISCAAEAVFEKQNDVAVHVICHGRLSQGLVAVGAETTGTTVSFDGMTWDLELSDEVRRQIAQGDYRQVTVEGQLRRVQGTERLRWIVSVEKLTKRDGKDPKPKAEFLFTAALPATTGKALPKSLEIAGDAWPVEWGIAQDLPTHAAALAGKTALLKGTIAANTEGGPKDYPIFHIQQLQAR